MRDHPFLTRPRRFFTGNFRFFSFRADSILGRAPAALYLLLWSWFNTWVTKKVQNMGDNLAKEPRIGEGSGCLGKRLGKWTSELNL